MPDLQRFLKNHSYTLLLLVLAALFLFAWHHFGLLRTLIGLAVMLLAYAVGSSLDGDSRLLNFFRNFKK